MKALKRKSRLVAAKLAAGATMLAATTQSFAADHSTEIAAAGTDGSTNLTAAVTAVLTIVAVVVGVGYVVSFLRRT